MSILVDSFAWLELFQGSGKGKRFLQILKENREGIYTSVLNLYEIRYRVEELKDAKTADEFIKIIESYAKILDVTRDVAIEASKIKLKMKKMGAIDCLILASAKINNLKVLSCDQHFDGAEGIIR